MIEWPLVSVMVNGVELAALIWLLIHLRHSSAPYQAALLDEQKKRLDGLVHTLSRVSSDHIEDRRAFLEADARIWEELRMINSRLDDVRCPLNDPTCPLVLRVGAGGKDPGEG